MNETETRSLPDDHYAEIIILNALMLHHDIRQHCFDNWQGEYFYKPEYNHIYNCIKYLHDNDLPVNPYKIEEVFKRLHDKQSVLTLPELTDIYLYIDNVDQLTVDQALKILNERKLRWELDYIKSKFGDLIFDLAENPLKHITKLTNMMHEVHQKFAPDIKQDITPAGYYDALQTKVELIRSGKYIDDDKVYPTGFNELDAKCNGGIEPGQLIVIAGRPGQGKTSLLLCILLHNLLHNSTGFVLFSLEMSKQEIIEKCISIFTGIPLFKLKKPYGLKDDDLVKVKIITDLLNQDKIIIDDSPEVSPVYIDNMLNQYRADHPDVDAAFAVDYLQLMDMPGTKDNRNNEIAKMTRALKKQAKKHNGPMFMLSQLSRECEKTTDKKPNSMSYLRDGGSIEADADKIITIYRHEYYFHDSPHKKEAILFLLKNRQGGVGEIKLYFEASTTKFDNLDKGGAVC